MYDESTIEDSLEACKDISAISNGITTDELFSRLDLFIKEKSGKHKWEDTLMELEENQKHKGILTVEISIESIKDTGRRHKKIPAIAAKAARRIVMAAFCLAAAFGLASFVNAHVAYQTTIEGESMEPSFTNNDSVIIQKLSYYMHDPERYDVIVFPVKTDSDEEEVNYIKRIIGLPGEIVQIKDGKVYINGSELDGDNYSEEEIIDPGLVSTPVKLAEDEYFVLGDNRNMSTDSRYQLVGMVKKDSIEGAAWYCIWPFSHIKKLY